MFSQNLELTLNKAFAHAREKRHEFITVEHLLYALLDNAEAKKALSACGANINRLKAGLGIFIEETTPHLSYNLERDIQPTLSFQKVLQRAIYQVQSSGQSEVTGVGVLVAIFNEQDSQSVYFLSQENITRADIVNYSTNGISKGSKENDFESFDMNPKPIDHQAPEVSTPTEATADEESLLEMYAVNLNEKALSGKIDPLIGRDTELMRATQILCRRGKNNPLFVGEAGVGKTAIAEGLAKLIVDFKVPDPLLHCTIYSLDLGILLAGTKYRGDFEKRFKAVLNALAKRPKAIVFIDEIHNLIGAGSATGGTMDASNLIKPLLTSGELRCMGATTYDEYRGYFAKDHALMRRFQKIDVEEPSKEDTYKILKGLQKEFESFHQVTFLNESLKCAVDLADLYINDRHFPDKAIDIIDEAGSYTHLKSGSKKKIIDPSRIELIVAKMARIPLENITQSAKDKLRKLPNRLKKVVFGQDEAINCLSNAVRLSRSGLRDEHKPVASILFSGPTGVGKTEVTKQLATELGVPLVRFDMSEYMEQHTVSRLIGAPPGYVGYDQGGLLTEAIIKQPHCVLLLDEIEKAHPDLFAILLQVMDYGTLTDNNGRQADFSHVTIIMTTNAGAEALEKDSVGFQRSNKNEDGMESIKRLFSPEFRNRIDSIIQFSYLSEDVIGKVVDRNLKDLNKKLKKQNLSLYVTAGAKAWLVKRGYSKTMGARPIERLIEKEIKQPLAEAILFSDESKGLSLIRVSLAGDTLKIDFSHESRVKKTVDA